MSIFTKRHYDFIAKVISEMPYTEYRDIAESCFSEALYKENNNFKQDKFKQACQRK